MFKFWLSTLDPISPIQSPSVVKNLLSSLSLRKVHTVTAQKVDFRV